jgi:heme exporter protein D
MESNFFTLSGYGQFVWSAFIFTFVSCIALYLKTNKELKKQEKVFLSEYKDFQIEKIKTFREKKIIREAFSTNQI